MARERATYVNEYLARDFPLLEPKFLAKTYARELKRRLGSGTKVRVVRGEVTLPRGWTLGNITEIEVQPPYQEREPPLLVTFNIKFAPEETSGMAGFGEDFREVVPVPRSRDPLQVVHWLTSEVSDLLFRTTTRGGS